MWRSKNHLFTYGRRKERQRLVFLSNQCINIWEHNCNINGAAVEFSVQYCNVLKHKETRLSARKREKKGSLYFLSPISFYSDWIFAIV